MGNNSIGVKDLLRLKHQTNGQITYGKSNLNAREVEQLQELDEKQIQHFKESLAYVRKSWFLFPDWFWVVGALTGIVIMLYTNGTPKMIGGSFILAYCAGKFMYLAGHQEGFTRGYEDGHTVGVNKALGIREEELDDLNERSTEMQIDENLIKRMDKP